MEKLDTTNTDDRAMIESHRETQGATDAEEGEELFWLAFNEGISEHHRLIAKCGMVQLVVVAEIILCASRVAPVANPETFATDALGILAILAILMVGLPLLMSRRPSNTGSKSPKQAKSR